MKTPLFSIGDFANDAEPTTTAKTGRNRPCGAVQTTDAEHDARLSREGQALATALPPLAPGRDIHFVTAGSWAMHNLVAHLQKQTGPAHLAGFTWSITEPAVNHLVRLRQDGRLLSLALVIDYQMSRWTADATALLARHAENVYTASCHAKGFLLWNDAWTVSVIGSANFSNNPRVEAGVISTDPAVFSFHHDWFTRLIEGKQPFTTQAELPMPAAPPPAATDAPRRLILVRGLPGAGKSTLARLLAGTTGVVCEADQFFTRPNGAYEFNADALPLAQADCFSRVDDALSTGTTPVIVANIAAERTEVDQYSSLAAQHGYTFASVVVENRHAGSSTHPPPARTVARMRHAFEVQL